MLHLFFAANAFIFFTIFSDPSSIRDLPIFNYLEKKLNGKIYFYQKKIDTKAVDASNKLNFYSK